MIDNSQLKELSEEELSNLDYELTRKFDIDFLDNFEAAVDIRATEDAHYALIKALEARKIQNELEEIRIKINKPIVKYQQSINQFIKKIKCKVESIENRFKEKIDKWLEKENDNPFVQTNKLEVEEGSLYTVKEYDFDIEDESLLEDDYKMPDLKKIESKIQFGIREIPGVRIFERKETRLRIKNKKGLDEN